MSVLTASPFHPVSGELLPVYLDAYLLGDLLPASAEAVAGYLRNHPTEAETARLHWEEFQKNGDVPPDAPLPWLLPKTVHHREGPRRARLPRLRLFALLIGAGLAAATAYGLDLLHEQKQLDQAGPVFPRSEQQMEANSISATEHTPIAN